jgi:4-amino-4-deoxy-L-arabinose transferase-like glycosyltransferase
MTKLESAIRIPRSAFWAAAILLVYFLGLTIPLVGPDEPRYAQVARAMFERGDWITPTLGGFNWFEKPALLYWLQIASYNLFGVSEFATRFGSALFGIGTVASLWILGRRVETTINDQPSTVSYANCLGLIAASTVGIIAFAHGASFDIILTFPITAALVSFYIYDTAEDRTHSRVALVLFYFFIGIAVLAKGLVGIIFPLAIVAFYQVLSWRLPRRSLVLSLLWGTCLAAAVAATWYVPMYLRHGYEFIDQFFIQHHFQRFTSNKYFHPQPFYFFLWVLPLMTIPWIPFFILALWDLGKRTFVGESVNKPGEKKEARVPQSLLYFAFAWLVVPTAFFSFSGSKLPGYVLPAVPAAIILSSAYIYRFVQKSKWRARGINAVAAGTFAVVVIAVIAVVPRFAASDSVKGLFEVANARGFGDAPVLLLHGVSHNAEFYAPGRIRREFDGKQKKLLGPPEVVKEMKALGGKPALVLVPREYLYQVIQSEFFTNEILSDNGEWVLVYVVLR